MNARVANPRASHRLNRRLSSWFMLVVLLVLPAACGDDGATRTRSLTQNAADDGRLRQIKNQFSSWDGSHKGLTKIIKQSLADPISYEHLKTNYDDRVVNLVVTTTYRSKNAAGSMVTSTMTAKFDLTGKLLEVVSKR